MVNIDKCKGDSLACVSDAFSCIAKLGTGGCGFESQLEAAKLALEKSKAGGANAGFL